MASSALQRSLYLSVASSASETSSGATTSSSSSSASKSRMRHVTSHPALPWIAYVLEPELGTDGSASMHNSPTTSGSSSSTSGNSSSSLSPHRQLIVQNVRSNEICWKLSLADLTCMMFEYDVHASSALQKQQAALRSLGPIQSLNFFDSSTLHATGMVHQKTSSKASERHPRWQFLLVQFMHRSVVLNIRLGPHSHALDIERRLQVPTVSRYPPFRPYVSQVTSDLLKGVQPTTAVLPLTPTLVWVGCADGSIKVVDWVEEKVLKSDRGPSDKNVAMRYLIPVNCYNEMARTAVSSSSGPRRSSSPSVADDHNQSDVKVTKRVVSISKKGTAYLWEIVLQGDTLIDVRIPVAKLEGHFSSSSSTSGGTSHLHHSNSPVGSSMAGGGSGGGNDGGAGGPLSGTAGGPNGSAALAAIDMEHLLVDFCAHRNLFLWFVPSGYKGSGSSSKQPTVLCWDLSLSAGLKRKNRSSVPKQEPVVVTFPTLDLVSGVPVTMTMGWCHPAFPPDALLCAVVNASGNLDLLAASLMTPGKASKAIHFFGTHLGKLLDQEMGTTMGGGPTPVLRVTCIQTLRRLDTAALLIGSQFGLIYMRVTEDSLGPRHAHFGVGFGTEWGSAVLRVEHSSVYWAQLDLQTTKHVNPRGRLGYKSSSHQKPSLVYTSPPCLSLPPEIQKRPIRLPPRFIPSPSGNFLCLYWPDELRYEILHLASICRRPSSMNSSEPATTAPSVANGEGILSFAWVGDEDVFALLHPPLEYRPGTSDTESLAQSTATGPSRMIGTAVRQAIFLNRSRMSSAVSAASGVTGMSAMNGGTNNDGSRFLPRVELKGLVGVTSNAAEISGSIAGATAKDMGDLTLRSRTPATTLFGGPVLCVACKSDKKSDGGTSYFYTKKEDSEDLSGAKAYVSSGPTLPYPDFCEWDDDGKLCAVVVQGLVAVYLSEEPEFTLLGNVQLGSHLEGRDVKVTGVKFVHGVLYCTTTTSVQCIFMGDLTGKGICCLDSYILASASGPSLPQESFSLSPSTFPFTLNNPVVLGYQSGSLLVSTVTDVIAIPLEHPLLRIACLVAAGQMKGAIKWLDSIPVSSHETLASFLERRGCADLAIQLPGVSLESKLDMALRHDMTDSMIKLVQQHGVDDLCLLDSTTSRRSVGILGREDDPSRSLIVCVGAYLLAQGKADMVQKLTQDLLGYKDASKNQIALVLASLLLALNSENARPLVQSAVNQEEDWLASARESDDYPIVSMVREHVL